jgi:hypothetical protein
MSVVAVKVTKDKITIGADSILVSGWTQEKDKLAKLNEINGMIIGDVGDAQEGALFLIYCKTRKPREASVEALVEFMSEFQDWMSSKIDETKLENQYIIVLEKKAFMMEGFFIKEVTDKASCHLSIYCEEPINIMEVEK